MKHTMTTLIIFRSSCSSSSSYRGVRECSTHIRLGSSTICASRKGLSADRVNCSIESTLRSLVIYLLHSAPGVRDLGRLTKISLHTLVDYVLVRIVVFVNYRLIVRTD